MAQSRKLLEARRAAFQRQLGICFWCGKAMAHPQVDSGAARTAEHLIPKSKGGSLERQNIVCACKRCNEDRGDMPLFQWLSVICLSVSTQHFAGILNYLAKCDIGLSIGPPQRPTVEAGLTANEGKSRHGSKQNTSDS